MAGWILKNWYFWKVVLEKTLDSPLDSKEIKPVNPEGNQPWLFIGRNWWWSWSCNPLAIWYEKPPDMRSQVIGKDPYAGKGWGQEEETTEDEMVGRHHLLNGHEFEQSLGAGEGSVACCGPQGHRELDMTEQLNSMVPGTWQMSINIWWVDEQAAKSATQLTSGSSTQSTVMTLWSKWSCSSLSHPHRLLQCTLTRASSAHSKQPVCMWCGPWTSSISITWEYARKANSWSPPRSTKSEALWMRCYKKPSMWFCCILKVCQLLLRFLVLFISKKKKKTKQQQKLPTWGSPRSVCWTGGLASPPDAKKLNL